MKNWHVDSSDYDFERTAKIMNDPIENLVLQTSKY